MTGAVLAERAKFDYDGSRCKPGRYEEYYRGQIQQAEAESA